MYRARYDRPTGYYRALLGDRFLAASDLLWHVQHHAQRQLGRELTWRSVPNPARPDRPGAVADVDGEHGPQVVTVQWSDYGAGTGLAGPGHTGG